MCRAAGSRRLLRRMLRGYERLPPTTANAGECNSNIPSYAWGSDSFATYVRSDPLCSWTLYRPKLHSMGHMSQTVYMYPLCLAWWATKVDRSKSLICCLKATKVIQFLTSRKDICHFLLVVNSNVGRRIYGFGAMATCWSKIAYETYRVSFNTLAMGNPLRICW